MDSKALQRYQKRLGKLKEDQNTYRDEWKVLRDYFWPRHGRFLDDKTRNKPERKNNLLINNAAIMARRTLQSGMQSGITNESRPWFKLLTQNPDLMDSAAVREWLDLVEKRMYKILSKSNAYTDFLKIYGQLGVFGTSSAMIQEDYEDVFRSYQDPIGSFYLATNERDVVDTRYRLINYSVKQVVGKFGLNNCSNSTKRLYEKANYDETVQVIQVVEPRMDRDISLPNAKNMPFASVYFEDGVNEDNTFLRVSGYEDFPCVAPRWELNGTNTYGDSPGMDALGDNKQLQLQERRKGQAIDKGVSPPLVGNGALSAGVRVDPRSNKTTWVPNAGTGQGLNPLYQINPTFVQMLSEDAQGVIQRINDAFYVDLFLMLSQSDRRQITAREIDERHEEKLLMLGPVLNRLRDELYDPYLARVFKIAMRSGAIPAPPDEVKDEDLTVQYISILHQAQQAVGLVGIDRYLGFAGNLVAVDPTAMDYVDTGETMKSYHEMTGAPAKILPDEATIKKVQEQRAQQQQQQQMQEQAAQGADTARVLSETRTDDPSALNALLQGMGG